MPRLPNACGCRRGRHRRECPPRHLLAWCCPRRSHWWCLFRLRCQARAVPLPESLPDAGKSDVCAASSWSELERPLLSSARLGTGFLARLGSARRGAAPTALPLPEPLPSAGKSGVGAASSWSELERPLLSSPRLGAGFLARLGSARRRAARHRFPGSARWRGTAELAAEPGQPTWN